MNEAALNEKRNSILINSRALLCFLAELSLNQHKEISEDQLKSIQGQLLNEIGILNTQLNLSKLNPISKAAAAYCLVTALDELIMRHISSHSLSWSKQSLLGQLHNETWGGERFYLILKYALKNPNQYRELIELLYILLSFGYQGKFHEAESSLINSIKIQLFKHIKHHKEIMPTCSLHVIERSRRFSDAEINNYMRIAILSLLTNCFCFFGLFNLLLTKAF